MFCPSCGQLNKDIAKFCGRCGKKLPGTAAETEAQRHPVLPLPPNTKPDTNTFMNPAHPTKVTPAASRNSDASVGGARRTAGIILVVLGLLIAVGGGLAASSLSNSYKPMEVYFGYGTGGNTEIYDSTAIGGNSEAVSYYSSMKYIFIAGGIFIACAGAWLYANGNSYDKIPNIVKHGQVIGLEFASASIEFDDGSRERLQYPSSRVVLVVGDRGAFTTKGNTIVAFKKE